MELTEKINEYDPDGHLENVNVWDWVVTHDGRVKQVTHDDMPDLHYSQIKRFATIEEVKCKTPQCVNPIDFESNDSLCAACFTSNA